ncbi:hypothetical protein JVU11DRAFT_3185 [Chiua virens]|nr:hypothetical protein JVU11DRAFT_3185 [Chiua virens]
MLLDEIGIEFASGVKEPNQVKIEEPPTLTFMYPELGKETTGALFVPYHKPEEQPADDVIIYYLHSLGSTGFPKSILVTYLTAIHWCIKHEFLTPRFILEVNFNPLTLLTV